MWRTEKSKSKRERTRANFDYKMKICLHAKCVCACACVRVHKMHNKLKWSCAWINVCYAIHEFEARSKQSSPSFVTSLHYTIRNAYNVASYECLNAHTHTDTLTLKIATWFGIATATISQFGVDVQNIYSQQLKQFTAATNNTNSNDAIYTDVQQHRNKYMHRLCSRCT